MGGRPLNTLWALPAALLRYLSAELDIEVSDTLPRCDRCIRKRTLSNHQQLACETLGFRWISEHQRRALVRVLRDEALRRVDREQLLVHVGQWLYEHQLIIAIGMSRYPRTTD
ncbi:DUF4158 domain-containing protein [Variovorax sp. Varisp36]|uniref:DUF4158 domain-containing protein n=1 Tax=Variovorax sp. Varisp36 TaxID=3243031 RepID=UPI0039A6BB1B